MSYHITPDGPKKCAAKKGNCPFAAPGEHHGSKSTAESYYYESLAMENPTFPLKKNEVDLPCAFGTMRVVDGDLSDIKSRTALISGLCGSLALAVHDKGGGKPYFVCYPLDDGLTLEETFARDGEYALLDFATHALVESTTKPGTYVDAYGQKTLAELKEFYGDEITLQSGTREMLVAYADDGVPELLKNFAKSVLTMDTRNESYNYMNFPDD